MATHFSDTPNATKPDTPDYAIRAILPEEAEAASNYLKQYSEGFFSLSTQFCLHFSATIFVCLNDKNEWQALAVSYLSPNGRKVALLEALVVDPSVQRKGIGSLLLRQLFIYWRSQCVFQISTRNWRNEGCRLFLEKNGYQPVNKPGLPMYEIRILPIKICLNNRRMRPSLNTINGEINEDTIFEYFQADDLIWGFYGGGEIKKGVLLGKMAPNGNIRFRYMQINQTDEIHEGHSKSYTEFLNDGRIALYEDWEWTGNRSGGGKSVIEEIRDEPL